MTDRPHRSRGSRAGRVVTHLVLIVTAAAMIAPFVWMALTSLKTDHDVAAYPTRWLPGTWQFDNYARAMRAAPFATYFRNSLIISLAHTLLNVLFASLAGYALARYRFRFRQLIFYGFIATLMIPTYTKIVPEFIIAKSMPLFGGNDILGQGGSGWIDTWWALIVPGAVTPFAVFLFRQFYLSFPRELEEAARMDGLGEFRIWARIASPLVKPAYVTVALLTFQESFNNFLWPLLVTTRGDLRVVQVGLAVFRQQGGETGVTQWNLLMAASTMASLPMIVLFLLTQRYFVRGLATVGIK
jgi:multiple sugar transport system permease protein